MLGRRAGEVVMDTCSLKGVMDTCSGEATKNFLSPFGK